MMVKKTFRQQGFVLVVVLCMLIMMTALMVGFNRQSNVYLRQAQELEDSKQALHCALAAFNIAKAAIKEGDDITTNETLRCLLLKENEFEIGRGKCTLTVAEESGKININLLRDINGRINKAGTGQLLRIIELLNRKNSGQARIDYDIAASIIDWTDKDDRITDLDFATGRNCGAESGYYRKLNPAYECKNAPLDNTSELGLVKSVTPQVFGLLCDYITVYGDGKININCAEKIVIESLSDKMDPALAGMIIEYRKIKAYQSVEQLRQVPGMTDRIFNQIRRLVTVRSKQPFYRITAQAGVNRQICKIAAVLKRDNKTQNVNVVWYQEL